MIRRLHVRGWRAFDELNLELNDGVTFVVAENGVGKTSLVEAAAWALFGELAEVDAQAARRAGSPFAAVELELELPDGRTLSIERQVDDRSQSVHAGLGGAELSPDDVAGVLAEVYGASREFLSRTTLIPSRAVAEQAIGSFELRSHLTSVFGVDSLDSAAEQLRGMNDEAEAITKRMRQAARRAARDMTELRDAAVEAELAESQANAALEDARATLDAAENRLGAALEHEKAVARTATARRAFAELVETYRQMAEPDPELGLERPTELVAQLDQAESIASNGLDDLRREAASSGRHAGGGSDGCRSARGGPDLSRLPPRGLLQRCGRSSHHPRGGNRPTVGS